MDAETVKITLPTSLTATGPLNRILYGPPGTGKTYRSVAEAVAIIEGKAVGDLMAQAALPGDEAALRCLSRSARRSSS